MKPRPKKSERQLMIKEKNLMEKSSLKYSGMELDDNLKFGEHIKNLCSKLNKFSGLIYRLRSILNVKQLIQIQGVRPACCELWRSSLWNQQQNANFANG